MPITEKYLEELAFLEMEEIKEELANFLSINYDLPYDLEYRVKSVDKLKQKIALHQSRGKTGETIFDIKDIIGLRISVNSEEEVIRIKDLIRGFSPFESLKDQFNNPRETGFKAYTYYYTSFGFNTEIQIMTKSMRDWTNDTHEEHDKRKYSVLSKDRALPKKDMPIKEEYLEELAFLEMEEIKDALNSFLGANYPGAYELEYRVKSVDKLKQKLALHLSNGIKDKTIMDMPDIIGFRISLDNEDEAIKMIRLIGNFAPILRFIDHFTNPKKTGFKSFAFYYDCFGFNTEIQIMTKNMRDWTNATHKEYDEKKYAGIVRNRTLPSA